jgi:hypothetical protein
VFFYALKSHKIAIIFKLKDIYLQREKTLTLNLIGKAVFLLNF